MPVADDVDDTVELTLDVATELSDTEGLCDSDTLGEDVLLEHAEPVELTEAESKGVKVTLDDTDDD